jgi:hypothetical protein
MIMNILFGVPLASLNTADSSFLLVCQGIRLVKVRQIKRPKALILLGFWPV